MVLCGVGRLCGQVSPVSATVRLQGQGLISRALTMQAQPNLKQENASQAAQAVKSDEAVHYLLAGLRLGFFSLLGPFWSAFVFLWLWRWFIVPLGVLNITYWHSFGLVIIIQFLLLSVSLSREDMENSSERKAKPDWAYWKRRLWRGNVTEAFFLVIGWLVHHGMQSIP